MRTLLKDNIWIEGFDLGEKSKMYDRILELGGRQNVIYDGKMSELTEEFAEQVVEKDLFWKESECQCQERVTCYYCEEFFDKSYLDFLHDACVNHYCLIYKK